MQESARLQSVNCLRIWAHKMVWKELKYVRFVLANVDVYCTRTYQIKSLSVRPDCGICINAKFVEPHI
jgi:hypothetical protein